VNPGGGSGWDEPPLDIQIPDDARELDREVLAYQREQRAQRRRNRLRRLTGPFTSPGTVMPLLASILAVCLVAGAMLSVATFSPATAPSEQAPRPTTSATSAPPQRVSTPPWASTAQPLGPPAGPADPAAPDWLRYRLISGPALTPGRMTDTIYSRPDGSISRRPLR